MMTNNELAARCYVRKAIRDNKVHWLVVSDDFVILDTPFKQIAYVKMKDERERLEIEEARFDAGLDIRPNVLRKKQDEANLYVYIKNPNLMKDSLAAWKVYYGPTLIGAYRSRWEAEQYRNKVIIEGGY